MQLPLLCEDKHYPEQSLIDLATAERMERGRALAYVTHTGSRDTTEKIDDILIRHVFRVEVMKADAVAPSAGRRGLPRR